MKVTPFTRDLLKALRDEKANGSLTIDTLKDAFATMKANEPDKPRPLVLTKEQAERMGVIDYTVKQ